jgi:hypothetical protein
LLPAFYLLGRRPITIKVVTTDTAITATTIGITTTTIIIVTGIGFSLSTVALATTATIEASPLFGIALVFALLDHDTGSILNWITGFYSFSSSRPRSLWPEKPRLTTFRWF